MAGSDGAQPRSLEGTEESGETRGSAVPTHGWAAAARARIFSGPGHAPTRGGQSPGAFLEAPPSDCSAWLRPPSEPRTSAGPRETRRKQGGNVRDPASSRCASTRPRLWLQGHGVSDPRGKV